MTMTMMMMLVTMMTDGNDSHDDEGCVSVLAAGACCFAGAAGAACAAVTPCAAGGGGGDSDCRMQRSEMCLSPTVVTLTWTLPPDGIHSPSCFHSIDSINLIAENSLEVLLGVVELGHALVVALFVLLLQACTRGPFHLFGVTS